MKILITSIGTTTAINLYKLLCGEYQIVGTDINPKGHTAGSLLVEKFEQVPLFSSPDYIDTIKKIICKYGIRLVIPVHDYEINALAQSDISYCVRIMLPPLAVINIFGDKLIANETVEKLGIVTGNIVSCHQITDYTKVIRRDRKGVGSKGVVLFDDVNLAKECISESYFDKDYFIQEFITGDEFTVDVACDKEGVPFLIIPRKRIEVKAGVATKVEIVNDQNLIQEVLKIYMHYKIPGFSNVQFILSGCHYYFIELNYRYGGMSISSVLASYNYVKDVVDSYFNQERTFPQLNDFPIKWGAYITRYYEEIIHYES